MGESLAGVTVTARKRGRPPEPDKAQIHQLIAGLVHMRRATQHESLTAARANVADGLGVSVDTVRRACRTMKDAPTWAASLALDFQLNTDPTNYKRLLSNVRSRLQAIKNSRGK